MKHAPRGKRLPVYFFCAFIGLLALLRLILPDRSFSENENRYLASSPKLTLSSLLDGSFTARFETYVTDQFPFRDRWIGLKSRLERVSGKTENNNVFFCSGDTLITRFPEPAPQAVAEAAAAVEALRENAPGVKIYLALIPSAAQVWADRLPANADTADQAALIEQVYRSCNVPCVDVAGALAAHSSEAVFYRTDHHWTSLGAYYGYAATADAMGLLPMPLEAYKAETVSSDFYGTVYSSSGVRWVAPDQIQRYVSDEGVRVTRYDDPDGAEGMVYDGAKLELKDQYSYFFGGNTPRLIIETGRSGGKLLLLRDSYSDSELPFFFEHFSQIHVLDLRYYRQSVQAYLTEHDIDTVLVNYGLSNFVSDPSVFLMGT